MTESSLIKYFGGKGTKLKQILGAFPVDGWSKYYEGYGGSGVVLLNKPRVAIEVYNDLNRNLVNFWKCLQSPDTFSILCYMAETAFYSEAIWRESQAILDNPSSTPVDKAFAFYYLTRSSFNGVGGFSHATSVIRKGMSKSARDYRAGIERFEAEHERWQKVLVMERDALELVVKFDRPGWLYYLDPPYVLGTRSSGQRYEVDQDDQHHINLVNTILHIEHAKILISGYDHPIYAPLQEAGWHKHWFKSPHSDRKEYLWSNYDNFVDGSLLINAQSEI